MTPDEYEAYAAKRTLEEARWHAIRNVSRCDDDAATVAILVRALELATPGMSDDRRAGLFTGSEE